MSDERGYDLGGTDDDWLDEIADAERAEQEGRFRDAERLAEKTGLNFSEALARLYP